MTCHEGIITLKKNLKTCKGIVRELKGYWTVCTKDNKKILFGNWKKVINKFEILFILKEVLEVKVIDSCLINKIYIKFSLFLINCHQF